MILFVHNIPKRLKLQPPYREKAFFLTESLINQGAKIMRQSGGLFILRRRSAEKAISASVKTHNYFSDTPAAACYTCIGHLSTYSSKMD